MNALETAIIYAESGFFVFPVQPKSKVPFKGYEWRKLSTNDVGQLQAHLALGEYTDANWALDCGRSGVAVLDVDNKNGKRGSDAFRALNLPEASIIVTTPSGGEHHYYKGCIPNSAGKLGDGLDTRGEGGYVLIPGSVNEAGKAYTLSKSDTILAPVPEIIKTRLGEVTPRKENRDEALCELDQEHNIQQAVKYLLTYAPEAVEGLGGDNTTYQVACRVRDYGLSELKTLELMQENWNNQRAIPPWSDRDLALKVRSAYKSAKEPIGSKSLEAVFPKSTTNLKCGGEAALRDVHPREWLLGYRYIRKFITLLIAPGGTGKSLHAINECISIASGKQLTHDEVSLKGNTWYYNTEDPMDELDRRVIAARKFHGLSKSDLNGFFYSSGYDNPLKLAVIDDKGRPVLNEAAIQAIISYIREYNFVLWVVDPLARCHSLIENNNDHMDCLMQGFSKIAGATGCAIGVVHHTPKNADDRGNMNNARGASALISAARIAHTLYAMDEREAKEFGIPKDSRPWYVRLDSAKANLAPPGSTCNWYRKQSLSLLADHPKDSTGVLEKVELTPHVKVQELNDLIKEGVFKLVAPGQTKSVYAIAKEIMEQGLIQDISHKSIRRRIEEDFVLPVNYGGCIYQTTNIVGKKCENLIAIKCIKMFEAESDNQEFPE